MFVESRELVPTVQQIGAMDALESQQRTHYFGSLMIMTYLATVLIGTAIMTLGPRCCACGRRSSLSRSREYEPVALQDLIERQAEAERQENSRRLLVSLVFTTIFATSLAAAIWSLSTDRLSKRYGLDWELYYVLFLLNCLWLEVQAIVAATRAAQMDRTFAATAFFEGTISATWPVIADTYDTLKDVLVGALCLHSDSMVLKVLGITSWLYLAAIRFVFLGWFPKIKAMVDGHDLDLGSWWIEDLVCVRFLSKGMAHRFLTEMLGSYAPVMLCPTALKPGRQEPEDDACCSCLWKMCSRLSNFFNEVAGALSGMAYKQVTPVKRSLLAIENIFQGLVGIAAPWFAKRLKFAIEDGDRVTEEQIREDVLEDAGIFTAVAPHLADCEGFTELKLLFGYHGIGEAGAVDLAAALEQLRQLKTLNLDLRASGIGDAGAMALAEAVRRLEEVRAGLWRNDLGAAGIAAWEQLEKELQSRGAGVAIAF
eukprot:Skav231586  [mRNA]  locus=scaffold232:23139:26564:+ [translate_table: standard]